MLLQDHNSFSWIFNTYVLADGNKHISNRSQKLFKGYQGSLEVFHCWTWALLCLIEISEQYSVFYSELEKLFEKQTGRFQLNILFLTCIFNFFKLFSTLYLSQNWTKEKDRNSWWLILLSLFSSARMYLFVFSENVDGDKQANEQLSLMEMSVCSWRGYKWKETVFWKKCVMTTICGTSLEKYTIFHF